MSDPVGGAVVNDEVNDFQFDPEDVILLMLDANERIFGNANFSGITRLEKLVFLLKNETDFEDMDRFFEFKAYNYGPFSKDVYESIDFLENLQLVSTREKSYTSFSASSEEAQLNSLISGDDDFLDSNTLATEKIFALTENGRRAAKMIRQIKAKRNPDDLKKLDTIISRFGRLPLNQIIRYVYRRHPEMAEKSIHPEAKKL